MNLEKILVMCCVSIVVLVIGYTFVDGYTSYAKCKLLRCEVTSQLEMSRVLDVVEKLLKRNGF